MANTAQAKKRARQSVSRNKRNSILRSIFRTSMKRIRSAIIHSDRNTIFSIHSNTASIIDKSARKGIIHKNKAARHKRAIASLLKKMV